uniref:Uncharacterized protein n=1 Tax=Arundo donax TaxID=35708 RepID=A0A0A9H3A1_ARUDO
MPFLHTQKDEHAHLVTYVLLYVLYVLPNSQASEQLHLSVVGKSSIWKKNMPNYMCPGKLYLHLYATVSGHLTPLVTPISTLLQK